MRDTTTDIVHDIQAMIDDCEIYCRAKPKSNAISVQIEKDKCQRWARKMRLSVFFGHLDDVDHQLAVGRSLLFNLKSLVILEILQNGSV